MKNSLFILTMVCLFLTSMVFISCAIDDNDDLIKSEILVLEQDETSIEKDEIQTPADEK